MRRRSSLRILCLMQGGKRSRLGKKAQRQPQSIETRSCKPCDLETCLGQLKKRRRFRGCSETRACTPAQVRQRLCSSRSTHPSFFILRPTDSFCEVERRVR